MEYLGIDPFEDWEQDPILGGEVLLWDDAAHERLDSKQLYFWRLAFSPRYPRKDVFEGLALFYEEASITSYVVYETLGDFDLLLRVWAPRTHNAEELELRLRQSLEGCSLWNLTYLTCKTEFHFSQNGSKVSRPSTTMLEAVGVPVIEAVNDYNQKQWYRHKYGTSNVEMEPPRPPEAEELLENGALRRVALDTRGIRMFMTFDHPRQPFRPETKRWVIEQILEKCNQVRALWDGRTETLGSGKEVNIPLPNISIYAGAGSMSDFLIMARAPHKHFHNFVRQMIFGIREIGLGAMYEMRPYTHVIADRMFSELREHRDLGPEGDDIADLIHEEEDESLELKATLATNFRGLIMANRRDADSTMLDKVVTAVCGMLNSPRGGTLIIGVLEVRRELEKAREPERYLRALEETFDYSPSKEEDGVAYPNAVVGIEVDLDPGPFADVDQYLRHLRDSLRSRINPNPWLWLRTEIKEIEGKRVCAVRVRPGDGWFYAKAGDSHREEFFVREGASTPALSGPAGDHYKRFYPREASSSDEQGE
ncbi:MAG: hypothetical protein JJE35_09685 [Thermoleophilia bacterium]|nr:hypothetical protein [Thermoleophilia bacterium]